MERRMPHEQLVERIRDFGATARESGQVARRLKELLSRRLSDLGEEIEEGRTALARQRRALMDERWTGLVVEYLDIVTAAREARVQYETHMMMLEARRSLRALQRR